MTDIPQPTGPGAKDVLEMLEAQGLPSNGLDLPDHWVRLGEYGFATWPAKAEPYHVDDLLREATEELQDDATLIAIDGHGVISWALHVLQRRGALVHLAQAGIGGPYRDDRDTWSAVTQLWDDAAQTAAIADIVPEGYGTLVVMDSDLALPRWAFVDLGADWDSIHWRAGAVDLQRVEAIVDRKVSAGAKRG